MPEVKEFLNPTSMLTPGLAGGMVVSISMPLAINFDLSFKWIVLCMSFLIALIIVSSFEGVVKKSVKGLYVILNALTIFSVSVGAGISLDSPPQAPQVIPADSVLSSQVKTKSLFDYISIISSAHADNDQEIEKLKAELKAAQEDAERQKQLRVDQAKQVEDYKAAKQKYDARWSW